MAKRTVINRACKYYVNTSTDADMLIQAINRTIDNEFKDPNNQGQDELKKISEEIKPYVGIYHDNKAKEEELPPFNYSKDNNGEDDYEKCLDYNAINIDQESSSGLTIRDRISIYEIAVDISQEQSKEGKAEEVLYLIYAVWPLGMSDKDRDDEKKEYGKSEWVNQLAKAVLTEASKKTIRYDNNEEKVIDSIDNPDIILLLHDHDIVSQDKIPLKTIDIDSDKIVEGLENCTLAVFQHSNKEFINFARHNTDNINAKFKYDEARAFMVDKLIFKLLTDFSEKLGLYSSSDDNNGLEDIITLLEKYVKDKHDPKHYLDSLRRIASQNYNIKYFALIIEEMNQNVNNMIKEITIPEKYKC